MLPYQIHDASQLNYIISLKGMVVRGREPQWLFAVLIRIYNGENLGRLFVWVTTYIFLILAPAREIQDTKLNGVTVIQEGGKQHAGVSLGTEGGSTFINQFKQF